MDVIYRPCSANVELPHPFVMNRLSFLVPALSAGLLLAACQTPQPHQVAFDESAFVRAARPGSGTVGGRAYAVYRGGEHPANGETVELVPVNAYTSETIVRGLLRGRILTPDPRLARYRRAATADAQGNFVITGVSSGDYYVSSLAEWQHHYESENADDTGTQSMVAEYKKPIFAHITVQDGRTTRIEQWDQRCPDIGPAFAHGG
jgi:hypothetical protein